MNRVKNNEQMIAKFSKTNKDPEFRIDPDVLHDEENINLGPLENFFFYLILDNVKSLFKIER